MIQYCLIENQQDHLYEVKLGTVAAPLIAAASNQKIFFGQLGAASIQERPLIKK